MKCHFVYILYSSVIVVMYCQSVTSRDSCLVVFISVKNAVLFCIGNVFIQIILEMETRKTQVCFMFDMVSVSNLIESFN